MATALEPNKTKIAKRVIEIFEFFGENCQEATVMDIVRRYGRPQSSTSELLASLVEMGLLYKNPRSRSYSPTPRVAALGASAQPEIIREGGLFCFMDRLAGATGNSVALFGMVGTHVQIFRLVAGAKENREEISYGASELLSASSAGLLLLSTLAPDQASRILWRLNAEAPASSKPSLNELRDSITQCRTKRYAIGSAGFIPDYKVAVTLVPRSGPHRPLALGVFYPPDATFDPEALVSTINRGVAQCAMHHEAGFHAPLSDPLMMTA